jgi:hypothetical protein
MKKIVYIAVDNGIDGRSKDRFLYASFDEDEIKKMLSKDESRAWRRIKEEIIDDKVTRKQALAKLDGIDRLVLNLPSWLDEK